MLPQSGTVQYFWFDQYDRVLRPGDAVTFDVDGTAYPARLQPDEDGQLQAVSTDARLRQALLHGRTAWVKRNGTALLRAPLAGFGAAYAQAEHGCGEKARP